MDEKGRAIADLRDIEPGATSVLDVEIPYLFYRGDEPPTVATPTGTWTDPVDAARRLAASVDAIASWARATSLDLRDVGVRHPVFGVLDGMQWLLFATAHVERHRAQAIGVRWARISTAATSPERGRSATRDRG